MGVLEVDVATTFKETAMTQHSQIVLPFARLSGKILQADFEGGSLSSDGGVLFLREIEAQIGVIDLNFPFFRRLLSEGVYGIPNLAMR